jgi:tetratricopeptide (TPR) repeat protein
MSEASLASPVAADGDRAKVFVSYSRKDTAFARMLVEALTQRGFDPFLDTNDIAPGEPWQERLSGLLAAADTVVFCVSPDWVASPVCGWELDESARLGKRFIPVIARTVAVADAPPAVARLNWIFCTETDDRDAALAKVDSALRTDLTWVREHTRLGELARHWEESGRSASAALRGKDLETAERWLDRRPADANAPTELHQAFIRASRRAATTRQRFWVGGSLAVAAIAIALAVFAEISRRQAEIQRARAEHTLTLATGTANGLVFDLAQKFRDVVGVPAATVKSILDRALALQNQLLSSGETNPNLRISQAEALLETTTTLSTLGDTDGALAAATKAQQIFEALPAVGGVFFDALDPAAPGGSQRGQFSQAALLAHVAGSYSQIGDVQETRGNLPAAMAMFQKSLAIAQQLVKAEPDSGRWQRDLSVYYNKVAEVEKAQHAFADALQTYQTSLDVIGRLAAAHPDNREWQRDVSVTQDRVGDTQKALGHLPEALASYQAGLGIRDRLVKADPNNAGWQRDLSISYNDIADVELQQHDLPAALGSAQQALALVDRLAKSDPGNTYWQRDLFAVNLKIGDVQSAQGDLAAALSSYQTSLAITDRLVKADAKNPGWHLDQAIAYGKIGVTQFLQGDLDGALKSDQATVGIMGQFVKFDPSNANWRYNLSVSYKDLGNVLFAMARLPDAAGAYDRAIQNGMPPSNAESYLRRAIVKLYLNDTTVADDAATAVKIAPADAYNALWLHVIRTRLNQDDAAELAANRQALAGDEWPAPVVSLFGGAMSADQILSAAASADSDRTRRERTCEADFFVGLYQATKSATDAARPLLQSAAQDCPNDFLERPAATLELQRLGDVAPAQMKQVNP